MFLSSLASLLLAAEAETKLVNVEQLLDKLLNWSIEAGKNILAALIIFVVGRFVIKQINRLFGRYWNGASWKSAYRHF